MRRTISAALFVLSSVIFPFVIFIKATEKNDYFYIGKLFIK